MLTPYQAIVDAVPLYRAANGEMGPAMAQRAQGTVSQIEQTYETDPAAREARDCLRVLGDVDAIIYAGKGYELADYCRRKAMSDERAMAMLQAMQALGCESGRAHTNVTIDVDPYLVGQGADVASRAAHVRALRSLHRCPRPLSTAELSAYLESVTPAHVRDACCVSCAIDQSGQSCIPPCVESGRKPGKPGKPSRPHEPDEPQRMPPWRVPGQTTTMVPDQTPTLPGGQTASMGPDQTATLPGGMTTGMVADQLAQINQGALGISQRPNQRPDRPSAYTQGNAIMQAGKAYFRSA